MGGEGITGLGGPKLREKAKRNGGSGGLAKELAARQRHLDMGFWNFDL